MSAVKPWRRGGKGHVSRDAPRIALDRSRGMSLRELQSKYQLSPPAVIKHARKYTGLCGADVSGDPCIMPAGHACDCRPLPY